MKHHNVVPGSDDYYRLKIGLPSCSGMANIVTPGGKPTTGERRRVYMDRLIAETLLQCSFDDRFENYWTRRGKQLEAEAAASFCKYIGMGEDVLSPGGFITDWNDQIGYSPDRLLKPKRGNAREAVEIKCLAPWNHVGYMREGPGVNYKPQVQGAIMFGFDAIHFWSYHPQCPAVHIITLRDEKFQKVLATEVAVFVDDLHTETERVRKMGKFIPSDSIRFSALTQDDDGEWSAGVPVS